MYGVIFLVLAAVIAVGQTDACTCIKQTPQKKFCSGDFAVGIKVLDSGKVTGNDRVYKIKIIKTYRMKKVKGTIVLKNQLWTAKNSAMCGLWLKRGKYYVISGSFMYPKKKKFTPLKTLIRQKTVLKFARLRSNICMYSRRFHFLIGLKKFKRPACPSIPLKILGFKGST